MTLHAVQRDSQVPVLALKFLGKVHPLPVEHNDYTWNKLPHAHLCDIINASL